MANPDLSLVAAYGGKFEKALMGKMYKELTLGADGVQIMPNVKNEVVLTRLAIGRGIKPYSGKFASADGQLKYSERKLRVEKAQRDLRIDPEKYRATWQAEQVAASYGTNANQMQKIPFAQFVWEQYMKENAEEIVNMLYHGKGVSSFPTLNTGNSYSVGALVSFARTVDGISETGYYKCIVAATAGQTPTTHPAKWELVDYLAVTKGFGQIIADAIANEGFNQIASTGAITNTDAYSQFTSVWRLQREEVKTKGAVILCSYSNYELLLDDYENKIKKNFDQTDNLTFLAKTDRKCIIKPVNWLANSGRLICTPVNNLVMGTDQFDDVNTITTIPRHYDIEASLSFLIGTQIRDLDVLTINDQA